MLFGRHHPCDNTDYQNSLSICYYFTISELKEHGTIVFRALTLFVGHQQWHWTYAAAVQKFLYGMHCKAEQMG